MKNIEIKIFNLKTIFKNKRNILLILILSLFLFILCAIFVSNHTLLNYINNYKTKNIDNRTINIQKDYGKYLTDKEYEKILKIENVTEIIPFKYKWAVISNAEYKNIVLRTIGQKELDNLKLNSGKKDLNSNNIICPINFVPLADVSIRQDLKTNEIINGNELINKTINITLEKFESDDLHKYILDTKEKEYKIIGTYSSEAYMMDNNECYASLETLKEIVEFTENNDSNVISNTYSVIVNNLKNKEQVKKDLKKIDIDLNIKEVVQFDYGFLFLVGIISFGILVFIIALIFLCIHLNIKRDLGKKEKEIVLYRSMGYEKKLIKEIYLFQYFIILSLSLIISLLFIIPTILIVKNYLSQIIMFRLMPLKFNYLELILLIMIGIIFPISIINNKIKSLLNLKSIKEIKE